MLIVKFLPVLVFCIVFAGANKNTPVKVDDKKSIQYKELMSVVRDNHDTIYSACMNYYIKVPAKDEEESMLVALKTVNHGYGIKVLLDDAKSANWNCTYGYWLLIVGSLLMTALLGAIIFKLISKFCIPTTFKMQCCLYV